MALTRQPFNKWRSLRTKYHLSQWKLHHSILQGIDSREFRSEWWLPHLLRIWICSYLTTLRLLLKTKCLLALCPDEESCLSVISLILVRLGKWFSRWSLQWTLLAARAYFWSFELSPLHLRTRELCRWFMIFRHRRLLCRIWWRWNLQRRGFWFRWEYFPSISHLASWRKLSS